MFGNNRKVIGILYILAFTAILAGVVLGTSYYIYKFIKSAEVKNYLDGYTDSLRNGMNLSAIIKSSVKSYSLIFFCIVIASFFKIGPFFVGAVLVRKGFISAFTTAAMIDVYGFWGVILSGATFVHIIVFIPILALLASVSVLYSKNRKSLDKSDKIIYIIFLIVIFTIFCGCAFFEGFLTTTFMKWLAFKVT